jgi:hypothetical protein
VGAAALVAASPGVARSSDTEQELDPNMATKILRDKDPKNEGRLLAVTDDNTPTRGWFALDPSGHLVATTAKKLKPGWAWATEADVKKADELEAKRVAAAAAASAKNTPTPPK